MITITNEEFKQLASFIEANYGIHLKEEKKSLVLARLNTILLQNNFKSFTEYYNYIVNDKTGVAAAKLMNKITTNHTYFMREPEHFMFFRDVVLPKLKKTVTDHDLRIWSAGCSSGEEAYTLAMIIDEFFGSEKYLWDTRILATDISDNALEKARAGIYSKNNVDSLPLHWRKKYFKNVDESSYAISDKIKNEVIFRKFNLMNEFFNFKRKFHVIFCRNVMIYFDIDTKFNLLDKFYDATVNGGYLFVGHSETFNREMIRYKYLKPAIYIKEE
ncbi:MAG TPA: protein-glutamate O-methyltransferase CheR [Bacillota bacterium]|nr:protein-glutamate O-methyltransferase CheR [Clostridiales bacterium]HOQ14145.1 protein-glutamate O-methyltransferase CheR [Bacillota bacterium]